MGIEISPISLWLLTAVISFFASALLTITGFGFTVVAIPFLLLIHPPRDAIQICVILCIVISVYMLAKIEMELDKPLLLRMIKGNIPGLLVGILILLYLDVAYLRLFIGITVLIFTFMLILNFKFKETHSKDFLTGGLVGALTASIAMPGPPIVIYLAGAGRDKKIIRDICFPIYLFVFPISLILQTVLVGTNIDIWMSSLVSTPPAIVGILLGQYVYNKINHKTFLYISYVILIATGTYLVVT